MHRRDAARPQEEAGLEPAEAPAPEPAVVALQRAAGNAAVARWMLQRQPDTGFSPVDGPAATPAAPAEPERIAKLRTELSGFFNVDEAAVLEQMKALTPAEVDIVLGDADLRAKAAGAFDDDEMYAAVTTMKGDPVKSQEWFKAQGMRRYRFVRTAATSLGDIKLDPALDAAVSALVQHLLDNYMVDGDVVFDGIGGVRDPVTAHRNSTAYHIRTGVVKLEALQALEGGKDLDGNTWYEEGWTEAQVRANAVEVWDGKLANEGYAVGDPRRLPNAPEVAMSTHCDGKAMDVTIPWRAGDGWHEEARELVARFGLVRPFDPAERWHFELPGASP